MFKSLFLAVALMFVAVPALAQNNTNPDVSAQLNQELARMSDADKQKVLTSIQTEPSTAEKVNEWVAVGQGIGEGLVAMAERLGIAANEFATTPLGKIAIALLVWNYMGDTILHIFIGFCIMFFGNALLLYLARKEYGVYNEKGKFIQLNLSKNITRYDSDGLLVFGCFAFVLLNLSGLITFWTA